MMHGKGVILEVVFEEVSSEQYSKMFEDALKDRFRKELSKDQLAVLAPAIEQARETALNPVDLAQNLVENWEAIFS